jgi:cytoskeletal protein RodZ
MIGRRAAPSTGDGVKPKGFDDYDLRLGDLMRGERATLGKSLLDVQRELKIKATYIAAIENADVSAFETPGFIAGYVRSYARYLGMDPEWAYEKFCREAGFTLAHGMSAAASTQRVTAARARSKEYRDPLADPNASFVPRAEGFLARVEPAAVGSLLVLVALIAGIGYGGWSVLQEVQRVQLAPVERAPQVVADIDALGNVPGTAPLVRSAPAADEPDDVAEALERPLRPEALAVPVMTPRDGPILAIRPEAVPASPSAVAVAAPSPGAPVPVQVVAETPAPVELLAVRPSWVRVSAADGTVLFEKILDAGERFVVPQMEQAAQLRSGNSGSVYFVVNGQSYGPAAPGAQVVSGVALSPEALTGRYALADLTADADLSRFVTQVAEVQPEPAPLADPAAAAD